MSKNEPRYRLTAFYQGFDPENMDVRIEKAAKRARCGAGFGFGERDLEFEFEFHRKTSALDAASRIKNIKGVQVELYDAKQDEPIAV